jgi:type I restriction enzyme S subunit
MTELVQTPFKLTLEETLTSAAMTLCLLQLEKAGTPKMSVEEVCSKPQYGFTASASSLPSGSRFVRITDIQQGVVDWESVPYCECSDPGKYELIAGDILVARTGSVGKSFLVTDVPDTAVFASYLIRLQPKPGFSSTYIYWCLQSQQFWQQIVESSRGSAIKNINARMLQALRFPYPSMTIQKGIVAFLEAFQGRLNGSDVALPELPSPLEEQHRIVVRIEELAAKVEAARALRQQAAAKAEVLVSSTLSYIFDYQPDDVLPEGWVWRYFRDLLFDRKEGMKTGPFGTLLQKVDVQSEGVPILGIANVHANRFVPGFTDFVSHQKAKQLSSYRLQEGDIVVARSGTVGRSCVVPCGLEPAPIMSTNLIRLRLNRHVFLPELLCHLFNRSRLIERHKESECRGSTRSFFTQKILSRLQVPAPPISEQRRIIAYLDNLQAKGDAVKQHQVATAAALDALLPSILDRAFKGEL